MNHQCITKIILGLVLFLITGCASFASDYKYKVLDPRYNSTIDEYTYDEETSRLVEKSAVEKKHPNRKKVLLVFLSGISLLFVMRTIRVLKKVDDDATAENFNFAKEFFAVEKIKKLNKTAANTAVYIKDTLSVVKPAPAVDAEKFNETIEKIKQRKAARTSSAPGTVLPNSYQKPVETYVKATMKKMQNPMLITTSKLASDKGFCLVEYKKEYSLIGYIGDEIFILNKFKKLSSIDLRTRLSERINTKDRYIVKLGDYKSLVEVTDNSMKMLMEL